MNLLFELGIGSDLLVQLACQAEYGTGVRAGALDQATEQKGRASQGALISSNPRENYRIIGTYAVPTDRFRVALRSGKSRSPASKKLLSETGRLDPMQTSRLGHFLHFPIVRLTAKSSG